MNSELKSLNRAFIDAVETADRCHLAQVAVDSVFVRSLVYDLVRFHGFPQSRTPKRSTLEYLLDCIACRLRDTDDPVVEWLSEAGSEAQFQFALGEFIRDTARNILKPAAHSATVSATKVIAGVLVAAGIDDDALGHIALIKVSTDYLAVRYRQTIKKGRGMKCQCCMTTAV